MTSPDGAPVYRLEVENVSIVMTSGGAPVVADFSVRLEPGTVLGLVGESGSGKSTASLSLLGRARPGLRISSGNVRIDDSEILSMSDRQLRRVRGQVISYVPQDPTSGLNPAIRVGKQLREALTNHLGSIKGSVDERISELLTEVGLTADPRVLRSYPHQLSGGQQQRIAIAMAFACRPSVVVLDEPTTGLDVSTQRRVLETVRELAKRYRSSAVYVSHDLAVVANLADYTAVMYAGRIVEMGPTRQVFTQPAHHYTRGLLRAIPKLDHPAKLDGMAGNPPRPGDWPHGCSFASRCPAVTDACRSELPPVVDVRPGQWVRCIAPIEQAERSPSLKGLVHAHSAGAPVLRAEHIEASFGKRVVLHGVDLEVMPGECTAVVGESGSGKTTLARCIVGLNGTWSGQLTVGDEEVPPDAANRPQELRRRVQYIFQNPYSSLNPRATIEQNLEEPVRFFFNLTRSDRASRIRSVLHEVALDETYAQRFPGQLSGGERQRVAIARALLVDPDVLVCDEVTSALDVSVQATVVERLRQLQADRGLALIFITHNLAVVRSIAQRVVVLADGRAVESGPTEHILDNPQHEYTRQLMSDLPLIPTNEPTNPAAGLGLVAVSAVDAGSRPRPPSVAGDPPSHTPPT